MKKLVLVTAAVAAFCGVAYAQRPAPNAAQTIQSRQASYKQMAAAQKAIGDQLRAGSPDIAQIRQRAAFLADRSVHVLRWFPRGTGPETGIRTRAKSEIWSDGAGFQRAGANFVVAARALNRAAASGDIARIRAAFPAVGRTCGACHDGYRAPAQ
ncbi:MAG TPA: cytochrome c [Allosphingosinicella sp.]|nr:cytochrome c [Allosphingosinicella sp.]